MAIAFNLPSEREATEESYSRLNRLLAELYDVLCHILVSRQQGGGGSGGAGGAPTAADAATRADQPDRSDRSRGECPRETDANNAPPYHLRCNSTYIVNLVMVVAIIKVSLASSAFNAIR